MLHKLIKHFTKKREDKMVATEEGLVRGKDLTQGPITKTLLMLSIPMIFSNIIMVSFQLVDSYWVGQLGEQSVAAIALSFPILFVVMSMIMGFSIAGTILIGQYKGKNDQKMIDYVATQSLILVGAIGFFLSIVGYFLTPFFVSLMGAETAVATQAISYLGISFLGTIFVYFFYVFQALLRGTGSINIPVLIVTLAAIGNFFLDPLFIMGFSLNGTQLIPALGVAGAAWATIFTQGLAGMAGILILLSGKASIHIKLEDMKYDLKMIKKIFFLGAPASVEFLARSIGMLLMTFIVTSFGTIIIAAYGLGGRFLSFVLIPAIGISIATSTIVAQCVGAKKIDRVKKTITNAMLLSFISLTLAGTLMFFGAEALATAFVPTSPETIAQTTLFIKIIAFTFGFSGVQTIIIGAIRGTGATKIAMYLSLLGLIVTLVTTFVFSIIFGYEGIWWAQAVSTLLMTAIVYLYLKRFDWNRASVIEHH
ncbi:MAG: MATE family efflux transporter [archaeon]|jgi:putative MATE family efflux protein